jgi:hypothetical protein
MPTATLPRMARKKSNQKQTQQGPQGEQARPGTSVIRVESDLVRMLGIIATATGAEVSAIVSPLIRPAVERRYAEVIQQLYGELPDKK